MLLSIGYVLKCQWSAGVHGSIHLSAEMRHTHAAEQLTICLHSVALIRHELCVPGAALSLVLFSVGLFGRLRWWQATISEEKWSFDSLPPFFSLSLALAVIEST